MITQHCKYCNTDKSPNEFYSYRPKKCIECMKNYTNSKTIKYADLTDEQKQQKSEHQKKHYAKYKDKIKQLNKDYMKTNYHKKKLQQQQQHIEVATQTL